MSRSQPSTVTPSRTPSTHSSSSTTSSATTPRTPNSSTTATSLKSSPPPPPLTTPALLTFQRDLLKLCQPLETCLMAWWASFEVMERVISSLENVTPRWQILLAAEARKVKEEEVEEKRKRDRFILHPARDPNSVEYFTLPQQILPAAANTTQPPIELGVLTTLPGLVSKLSTKHERQIEIAYKLLCTTHHELTPSLTQLSTLFDQVHDLYHLQKKQFTPQQLTHWTVTPAKKTNASGSGHKKATALSSAGKGKKGAPSNQVKDEPTRNSVGNIMQRIEEIEKIVQKEYDSHLVGWSEFQSALRMAATANSTNPDSSDSISPFQVRQEPPTPTRPTSPTPSSLSVASSTGMDFLLAFSHLSLESVFELWHARHSMVELDQQLVKDELLPGLKGRKKRTKKSLEEDDEFEEAEDDTKS